LTEALSHSRPEGAKFAYALQYLSMMALIAECSHHGVQEFFVEYARHMRIDDDHGWRQRLDAYIARNRAAIGAQLGSMGAWLDTSAALVTEPWAGGFSETCAALRSVVSRNWPGSDDDSRWRHGYKYFLIVHSYGHMLLNRLGLGGRQEFELVQALAEVWTDISVGHRGAAGSAR
jgi:hypothetical protein